MSDAAIDPTAFALLERDVEQAKDAAKSMGDVMGRLLEEVRGMRGDLQTMTQRMDQHANEAAQAQKVADQAAAAAKAVTDAHNNYVSENRGERRVLVWIGGVLNTVLLLTVGWAVSSLQTAERINLEQHYEIRALNERIAAIDGKPVQLKAPSGAAPK